MAGYYKATTDTLGGDWFHLDASGGTSTATAIVVYGDLDAANVAVHIPGTGIDISNIGDTLEDARNIYDAATTLDPDTAVVVCLCYNTPNDIPSAGVRTLLPGDRGYGGAQALVGSLGLSDNQFVTLSAHSFGATIAYRLKDDGYGDIAVLAGPAPLGVYIGSPYRDVDDDNGVYWGIGGQDFIGVLPGNRFGSDAYIEDGGNRFYVGPDAGHSDYYIVGSDSLRSIAALVVGASP